MNFELSEEHQDVTDPNDHALLHRIVGASAAGEVPVLLETIDDRETAIRLANEGLIDIWEMTECENTPRIVVALTPAGMHSANYRQASEVGSDREVACTWNGVTWNASQRIRKFQIPPPIDHHLGTSTSRAKPRSGARPLKRQHHY